MALKILIVDDEPDVSLLISQQFEEKIESGEFEFVFAENGMDALEKLSANPDIEIILTDINMPIMDGIELLNKVMQIDPLIKTVMVSAYSDMENIRKAMNRGAFDFLTKPINFEDLKVTLDRTIIEAKALRSSLQEHDRLIDIQKELEIAKKIQEAIIPHNFDPMPENKTFEIYGKTIPSRIVGGDFFDFFTVAPTKLGITIADVSGKGIPAALFMAMTRAAIRCFASQTVPVTDCVNQVNHFLCAENESSMFVTLFYCVFDTENENFHYCNAGHNPPLIISQDGKITEIGKYEGISLGILTNPDLKEKIIQLKKNDCIVFYTDGVTEAMNINGEMYSEERLEKLLLENNDKPLSVLVQNLLDDIKAFVKDADQSDDISILCFRYLGTK